MNTIVNVHILRGQLLQGWCRTKTQIVWQQQKSPWIRNPFIELCPCGCMVQHIFVVVIFIYSKCFWGLGLLFVEMSCIMLISIICPHTIHVGIVKYTGDIRKIYWNLVLNAKYFLSLRMLCWVIFIYCSLIHINRGDWISPISQSILNQFLWNCTHTMLPSCRDYPGSLAKSI